MEIHVLNGDALAEKFPFHEQTIICRECLMDGPSYQDDEIRFWEQRAEFIKQNFESAQDDYHRLVIKEFELLKTLQPGTINLWFEQDLFCQTNLWFTIDFISKEIPAAVLFLVTPDSTNDPSWSGFGKLTSDELKKCYEQRVHVNAEEKQLAQQLWNAYRKKLNNNLESLSQQPSNCFPALREVCRAHIERNPLTGLGRPQQRLLAIINEGETDFPSIFKKFRETEGIYGFGDIQVKKLLSDLE